MINVRQLIENLAAQDDELQGNLNVFANNTQGDMTNAILATGLGAIHSRLCDIAAIIAQNAGS